MSSKKKKRPNSSKKKAVTSRPASKAKSSARGKPGRRPPPVPEKSPALMSAPAFLDGEKLSEAEITDIDKGPIFSRLDKLAFLVAGVGSLVVYYFHLAELVNLEDGGELATASDYLGVPHPPGYPIWTLLTWLFQWIFHSVEYGEYPNPAWGIAFASAFFAAISNGVIAMLICKSGQHLVRSLNHNEGSFIGNWQRPTLGFVGGMILFSMVFLAGGGLRWVGLGLIGVATLFGLICLALEYVFRFKVTNFPSIDELGSIGYGVIIALLLNFGLMTGNQQATLLIIGCVVVIVLLDWLFTRLQGDSDHQLEGSTLGVLCCLSGIAGGLLLAFSEVQYSQAVIIEVYSLNTFFMSLIALFTYCWMCRPTDSRYLYIVSFLLGLGLTNHQSLVFIVPFLLVALFCRNRRLFISALSFCLLGFAILMIVKSFGAADEISKNLRDLALVNELKSKQGLYMLLTFGALLATCIITLAYHGIQRGMMHLGVLAGAFTGSMIVIFTLLSADVGTVGKVLLVMLGLLIFCSPLLLHWIRRAEFNPWPQLYGMFALTCLGLAFLLYMPFASEQNPPMNWAYARTMNGFTHSIFRKQYESISPADNLGKYTRLAQRKKPVDPNQPKGPKISALEKAKLDVEQAQLTYDQVEAKFISTSNKLSEVTNGLTAGSMTLEQSNQVANAEAVYNTDATALERAALALDVARTTYQTEHRHKFFIFYQMAYFFYGTNSEPMKTADDLPPHHFSMVVQFTIPISLLTLLPFLLLFKLGRHIRTWLNATVVGFLSLTVIFIIAQYPQLNNQDLFIKRVQYIQAHAIFSMWAGYGLLILAMLLTLIVKRVTGSQGMGVAVAFATTLAGRSVLSVYPVASGQHQ